MTPPAVDVVIPTYNAMPLLETAVRSVLAQTVSRWHLYVVDDGSTDDAATRRFVEGLPDPRVSYLRQDNAGQASARNRGIAAGDGQYVAFLDADDAWYPDKLERQVALLLANPALGLVYAHHDLVDAAGGSLGAVTFSPRGRVFDELLDGNRISGSASTVLMPRAVLADVGPFREDFRICEDWEMWLRVAHRYPVDLVPERLAALRVVPEGMQGDRSAMADGLLSILPAMRRDLPLSPTQDARLAAATLWEACQIYGQAGRTDAARACLVALVRQRPLAITDVRRWGAYARLALGPGRLRRSAARLRRRVGSLRAGRPSR